MDTEPSRHQTLLAALESPDWSSVLAAVSSADTWMRTTIAGDPRLVIECDGREA